METAAIAFHVVFHSKVKSIVVFGMHVGDTSCADCGKKKASSEGLEESLRFTQCMHQMSLVTGQICVETWWFGSTQGCAAKAAGCPSTVEIRKCAVHVKPCLVCVICTRRACPVLLACLLATGDMESSSYCGENPACQHSVEACDCYYMTHCKKHNWVFECDKCLFSHCRSDVSITSLIRVKKSLSNKKG
jgi:hypothetical protein